ncbi:hypothetical protein ROBYS_04660 [Roseobacter sp. OBYS 0001]|nr:hypothetical protein ROBYS_04660 [Roseobacter sp. OBYS 0001]
MALRPADPSMAIQTQGLLGPRRSLMPLHQRERSAGMNAESDRKPSLTITGRSLDPPGIIDRKDGAGRDDLGSGVVSAR